MNCEL